MSYKFRNHIKNQPYTTMFVSQNKKFIYMRAGRTASTTISMNLKKFDPITYEEVSKPYFYKTGTNKWLETTSDQEIFNNFFIFTIIRNPFDRLISAWKAFANKGKVNNNFEQFIKNRGVIKGKGHWLYEDNNVSNDHWLPLHYYVEFNKNESFINYVGKYENLNKDWDTISKKINMSSLPLSTSPSKSYRKYYTDELVNIVSKYYKRDLELFNYEF
tara:strand:+ start:1318 stop:1965 length:648 start_codon:yes stop_codon:yes gene_type:complete